MLAFNNFLSSERITIERAFGMFCRKWGILWRPLEHSIAINSLIIKVCAKLHNASITHWKNAGIRADDIATREKVYKQHHDSSPFGGNLPSGMEEDGDIDVIVRQMQNNRRPEERVRAAASSSRKEAILSDLFAQGIFYSSRGSNALRLNG
jgi:hypothetical protein